jgi:hypothetical protein
VEAPPASQPSNCAQFTGDGLLANEGTAAKSTLKMINLLRTGTPKVGWFAGNLYAVKKIEADGNLG